MIRPPLTAALLLFLAAAPPAAAQQAPARPEVATAARPGPVAAYTSAARLLPLALAAEDPVSVLAAVRLARSVLLRPASGWQADPAAPAPPAPLPGLPRDPGSGAALQLLQLMTEGDADLRLLADELLARPPGSTARGAAGLTAGIAPDTAVTWRIPFYGAAPAEVGMVTLTDTPLQLSVRDEAGADVCAPAPAAPAALCAFAPARNGWFLVEIRAPSEKMGNEGGQAAYLLLTN